MMTKFGIFLGLIATVVGQGQGLYAGGVQGIPGGPFNSQQFIYPGQVSQFYPYVGQQQPIPWQYSSFPYQVPFPYPATYQPSFQYQYPINNAGPLPGVPSPIFQDVQPSVQVQVSNPVVKEVEILETPPVQVPVNPIVPVSPMDAALLELENEGNLHAEKYYYFRSELPSSYAPTTSVENAPLIGVPQTFPNYPGNPTQFLYDFQRYPTGYSTFPSYNYVTPTYPGTRTRTPTQSQPIPTRKHSQNQPTVEGIPIAPYLKPGQGINPEGKPFTVTKRKHMEVYQYQ